MRSKMQFRRNAIPPWQHNEAVRTRKAFKRFVLASEVAHRSLRHMVAVLKEGLR